MLYKWLNNIHVNIYNNKLIMRLLSSFILLNIILVLPVSVFASPDEDMDVLRMFYRDKELVVTPTRTPKPVSQVPENITVITAEEIKDMNAHTLTDVLNTIPGMQVDIRGGVGSAVTAVIQGSHYKHVLVIIDGVTLNNLSDHYADISAIPVQHISRIEIIKGPASSSWGSSLGGVINIITKSADEQRGIGGTVSAAYGERNTGDYRTEVSGSTGSLGYYLYAGNIVSDGMRPNTRFYENNVYSKVSLDVTDDLGFLFTFGYNKGDRGLGEDQMSDLSFDNNFEYLFSTLSINYAITNQADAELSLRTSRHNVEFFYNERSTGSALFMSSNDDETYGASVKFRWQKGMHNLVVGADYDDGDVENDTLLYGAQGITKQAVFINDTIALNGLTLVPGIRYDHTDIYGDFLSPSFGATYQIADNTVIRGYVSRGFNIPTISDTFASGFFSTPNPDLDVEKIWSVQAGVETTALKCLWFRANLFRHDISDAIRNEDFTGTSVNKDKQRRQGFEIETETMPVYNTSVFAGFAFIDAKDRVTDERLYDVPRYTYDVGINYNDRRSFKASLTGHYIWWIADPDFGGEYNSFVWDANLAKSVRISGNSNIELFLTGHNIFNAAQYSFDLFKNPRRWIEAGARLNF